MRACLIPAGAVFVAALLAGSSGMAQEVMVNDPAVGAPLRVGEYVFVDVYREPELTTSAQIDNTGAIVLPHVGAIPIAGLTEGQATLQVSQALSRILRKPRVTVSRSAVAALPRPLAAPGRAENMTTEIVELFNADAQTIRTALQGMTSEGGSINFDPSTNSLIITDTPQVIQNVLSKVAVLDRMPSQRTQVRISAKIAEVQVGALKELGIRWFTQGAEVAGGYYPNASQDMRIAGRKGNFGSPLYNEQLGMQSQTNVLNTNLGRRFLDQDRFDRRLQIPIQIPAPGQMFLGLLNEHIDLGVMIDALAADDKAELLTSPNILTVNHQPAIIREVEEFPYTEFGTTVGGIGQFSTRFIELGIVMEVTPHVYRDDAGTYVKLDLETEVSFPVGTANGIPIRSVRSHSAPASVRDGQTLVVGGIFRNEDRHTIQKVPGLGSVPLVGKLFKRTESSKTKSELMIFVTPTVHPAPETVTWERMLDLPESFHQAMSQQAESVIPLGRARDEQRRE